jgi:hypothetical protein
MDNNGAARQTGWQPGLHWALVWIFALVLPWICWGAQATPGHPHLRAHFVFGTPPPLARNAQAAVRHAATALANGRAEHCTATSPSLSAGLSTPPVLAVTLLLLAILTAASLPPPCIRPGFRLRTAALYQSFPPLLPPKPPPRQRLG